MRHTKAAITDTDGFEEAVSVGEYANVDSRFLEPGEIEGDDYRGPAWDDPSLPENQ